MTLWKLSAKCCALPSGGRFYSGLEQLKTFCQPQTLAAFAGIFSPRGNKLVPRKRQLGISGVKSLCESTARDHDDTDPPATRRQICPCCPVAWNILTLMNNDMALIQLHHIPTGEIPLLT